MSRTSFFVSLFLVSIMTISSAFATQPTSFWPETQQVQSTQAIISQDGESTTLIGTFNPSTNAPVRVRGGFEGVIYSGDATTADLSNFIDDYPDMFKVESEDLDVIHAGEILDRTNFTAQQLVDGHPVLGTRVILRFGIDGSLVTWGADIVDADAEWTSDIGLDNAAEILADYSDMDRFNVTASERIWVRDGANIKAAFKIHLMGATRIERIVGLVLADGGEVVGVSSEVYHADISGEVRGQVLPRNLYTDPEERVIANQFASVSEDLRGITDSEGLYVIEDLEEGMQAVDMVTAGPYVIVQNASLMDVMMGGQDALTFYEPHTVTEGIDAPGEYNFSWDVEGGDVSVAGINVFYHANLIRDWWEDMDPDLNIIQEQFHIYPDQRGPQMETNAGFMPGDARLGFPNMIMFGFGNNQMNNFGTIAEIIYHEYTHAVNVELLEQQQEGEIGAMHEGCSDYFAATVVNSPEMGAGIWVDRPDEAFRNLDNDLRFPEDMEQDNHHNGLIISGALWDMREALGADIADPLAHYARYGSPRSFDDFLNEILLLDDDDGDLENGTPNWDEIVAAFQHHGIGEDLNNVPDRSVDYSAIPHNLMLSTPYPNPFNPQTKVSFNLPHPGEISLVVYDMCGKEVMQAAQGYYAAGQHNATVNLVNEASGMYIFKLQGNGMSMTRKAMLFK